VAKHKHPRLRFIDKVQQPAPPDPERNGLNAFLNGNYQSAIAQWSVIRNPRDAVKTALAEAYLRRALEVRDQAVRKAYLDQAAQLQPDDPRITYQRGIDAYRAGDLPRALALFQSVLQADPTWPGASLLAGLATLRQDPHADLAALSGSTPEIRAWLQPVQTLLLDGQPDRGDDQAVARLWYALGLINAGDGSALEPLEDNRPLPAARATAIRRSYRGVAAAQRGDLDAAVKAWRHTLRPDEPASSTLATNLFAALLSDDAARLRQEDLLANSPLNTLLSMVAPDSTPLAEQLVAILDQHAQQAAVTGDWQQAATYWEKARDVVSRSSGLGSPRPLYHNLAIAYEGQERWHDAADAWRGMLRTRPRTAKQTASRRESDYTDAQWRWIQDRVIECYKRADEPYEAVQVFRQIIKKDPNDLDARLQLALALIANAQEQSAMHELEKILQIDPSHVDARVQLGLLASELGQHYRAVTLLREAHTGAPEREDVTHALAAVLRDAGVHQRTAGLFQQAVSYLEEGAAVAPNEWTLALEVARAYIDWRKPAQARTWLERVATLAADRPEAQVSLVEGWAMAGDMKEAHAALERAEAIPGLPVDFHIQLATRLLAHLQQTEARNPFARPRGKKSTPPLRDFVRESIERGVARQAPSADYLVQAARAIMFVLPELAMTLAERAIQIDPESGDAALTLGTLQALNNQPKQAEQSLRSAVRLARKAHDDSLRMMAEDILPLVRQPDILRAQLQLATSLAQLGNIGGLADLLDLNDLNPDMFDLPDF
jgi:tetratricopeptide (TPR) repeat protein